LVALLDLLRERYDIIHIQKPHDLPIAVAAKRLVGTRIVLGCHGTDFAPLDTRLVRWADSAVSCSRFNAAAVAARYGIEPLVVYNGVDLDAFRPLPADPELRRRYARPDEKLLVYVGRLIDWKGLQDIIAALSAGVKPATTLLVIGEGEYRAELERIAKEHGVADRVIFVGYVPHERLPAYYALADVVVAASFAHETFGISLCEGMACGKPVVATAFGGFPEVVEDGVTGFLVPPQNPQALAAKLALLLADEELRRRMGEAGRARMQALFTWGAVADRVEVSYRAAMSQS
jgi:glycosyltransferase involved in cell wall biosynthesis